MASNCQKHLATILTDEGVCSSCQDELVAATPELAPLVRHQRRTAKLYASWMAFCCGLATGGAWLFYVVREWHIWRR